jgi:hypothetical protein
MSLRFDKDTLKEVYDEEIRRFGIGPGARNRLQQFLEVDLMRITNDGRTQLTQEQLLPLIHQMNTFTTADIVAYCLQLYYNDNDVTESLYSSGIERTTAYFDTVRCEPSHPTYPGESKPEYIETVLFNCFSKYITKKGYRARDIYRFIIRFGCIFNVLSSINIVIRAFTLLSNNNFFLQSGESGTDSDRNVFTGSGKTVILTSNLYSQIVSSSLDSVSGPFLLKVNYGNLDRLDARPYAYVLSTLFYMRDNRVNDYEGTRLRIMQEADQARQKQRQKQQDLEKWMEWRMNSMHGTQGGKKGIRIKSKKNKKTKNSKNTYHFRNSSRRQKKNKTNY